MKFPMPTLAIAVLAALWMPRVVGAQSVTVTGGVEKTISVDSGQIDSLGRQSRLMKLFSAENRYVGTFEQSGIGLRRVLERAGVTKKTADGFARPLDMYLIATNRSGRRMAFSYGEIFMAGDDGAFLLADQTRNVIAHHHDEASLLGWNRALLGPGERERLRIDSCAACHRGPEPPVLFVPQGFGLVPGRDRRSERFLSELTELRLCQAGTLAGVAGKRGEAGRVEEPTLVLPDGTRVPLTRKLFDELPAVQWSDATFGEGRGFHGEHSWSGVGMLALLRKVMSASPDPRRLLLLVTASDGYRAVFSGGEMAYLAIGEGLILADREDGQPFGPKDGRYRVVPRGDFFVDRSVRSVKELRLVEISEGGDPCGLPAAPASAVR